MYLLKVFDSVLERCGVKTSSHQGSPRKITDAVKPDMSLDKMPLSQFQVSNFHMLQLLSAILVLILNRIREVMKNSLFIRPPNPF